VWRWILGVLSATGRIRARPPLPSLLLSTHAAGSNRSVRIVGAFWTAVEIHIALGLTNSGSGYGLNANASVFDVTMTGMETGKASNIYYGPPAWTVTGWLTRTSEIASSAIPSAVTLWETLVDSNGASRLLSISLGDPKGLSPELKDSIVISVDGLLLWVPSSHPISFELNTPVHVAVVFIMGVQASFNDPTAPYRVQLYVNGALLGSAIKTTGSSYNGDDGGLSSDLTQFGAHFHLSTATATLRTTAMRVQRVAFFAWPLSSDAVKQASICGQAAIRPRCWLPPGITSSSWCLVRSPKRKPRCSPRNVAKAAAKS
jgi:hypothetical protein